MSDFLDQIRQFNSKRIPELVQLKYQFMSENLFRFYRGTCHLFYDDLSKAPEIPVSPASWISGDLHLENFGTFKGDNRLVYFDINDFDEAVLAPVTWEITRTLTSIFVAFHSMHIEEEKAQRMAQLFLKTYGQVLASGKAKYIETKTAKGIVCDFLKNVAGRKYRDILARRTQCRKERLVMATDNKRYHKLDKPLRNALKAHLTEWINHSNESPYHFDVEDVVFRVAGTGSVGVKRYACLLKSQQTEHKYLLLDMKQAVPSSLSPYTPIAQPSWSDDAERVISIQKRMQNISPALLSTTCFEGDCYILQEMQPAKDNFDFRFVKDRYRDMYQVIDDMAMLTASSQLRSSGRQGSAIADELIAFGNDTNWQAALINYSMEACKRTAARYQIFQQTMLQGEI